jgi:hypothetical protein
MFSRMTIRGANYIRRKLDDYATPSEVLDTLFEHVRFRGPILDPACGRLLRVVHAAERHGYAAGGDDIIHGHNFLDMQNISGHDIVTNPPYGDRRGSLALDFIVHALVLTKEHRKRVAMLLPIDFDSGKTRQLVFQHRAFALKLVLLDRVRWFNGQAGSTNHAWYIWNWMNKGPPVIRYARTATEE